MAQGAFSKKSRNTLVTNNKYQDRMILLTFFPSTLMFLSFICIILISNPGISKAVFHTSSVSIQGFIHQFLWLIIFLMCLIYLAALIAAHIISLNMFGAFRRIIFELNEIIDGRSQKAITSRPDDELTKDLLEPINVLVKFYVDNKKS